MRNKNFIIIALCLALIISCTACKNLNDTETQETIHNGTTEVEEQDKKSLTLDLLTEMVDDGAWENNQQKQGISYWLEYDNSQEDTADENSVTKDLLFQLSDSEKKFLLEISYYPDTNQIDMIRLRNDAANDAIILYYSDAATDDRYAINKDITGFVSKDYEFPEFMENLQFTSDKLTSDISLGPVNTDGFLHFQTKEMLADNYIMPKHADGVDSTWYALGGVGVGSENMLALATVDDGKLKAYDCIDNHMSAEFVKSFEAGGYSACLYKYSIDLFTVAEAEASQINSNEMSIEYWVLFFTDDTGSQIDMMYFNTDYFTESQVESYL